MARRPPTFVALLALVVSLLAFVPGRADAWSRGPIRIAGADRYETAVRISSAAFAGGAASVVVASGESFPDGLAAGPLAALYDAPVLLTATASLPAITGTELDRLDPERVVVVGGPAAVEDAVLGEIQGITGVRPTRVAGESRYSTATAVASLFPTPAPVAFVANGMDFPDALAGGAAAALAEAPLLLTPPDSLPPAAGDQLARLAAPEVLVLGGSSAVSDAVVASIEERSPGGVRRLAGMDRYGTAAAIANDRAPSATQAILATGESFPDALAGAPLARHLGAPILLTAGCQPPDTTAFLRAHGWADVTVVGGTGAVPEFGLSRPCSPIPDGELAPGLTLDTHVLAGPTVARIVAITRRAGWDVRATTASGNVISRLHTTDIARRLATRVAVNGTFFTSSGEPSYALAVDGRIQKAPGGIPAARGTVLALDPTNPDAAFYDTPSFEMTLGGETVDSVNSGLPVAGEIALFTREYNKTIAVTGSYCRASLDTAGDIGRDAAGDITQTYDVAAVSCSDAPIDDSGADVAVALEGSPEGDFIESLAGDQVTFTWTAHPNANGTTIVIGGNVRLVVDGTVATDVTMNSGPFFDERAPRTAVCTTANGTLLLVTVDGRQPGYSVGWTPRELADYLISIGCRDALNLDGGGSTAVAVDGMLANRPSDASGQRAVGSALFVSPR
ncbi:MAG TPA: cell wall-binding repeat-containing protein [Acidimicrobiales bacterium]|nr:cell wall-binding repeat-containing protein [Acidimicrobiales bacterium]